jgi:hypothetical protein
VLLPTIVRPEEWKDAAGLAEVVLAGSMSELIGGELISTRDEREFVWCNVVKECVSPDVEGTVAASENLKLGLYLKLDGATMALTMVHGHGEPPRNRRPTSWVSAATNSADCQR